MEGVNEGYNMKYMFDIEIAKLYGLNEAIFIQNLYWWLQKNKIDNRNFHTAEVINSNGDTIQFSGYWTYNSMRSFVDVFPFWTQRQIRTVVKSCRDKNIIYVARFNREKYDKTLWYTLAQNIVEILNTETNKSNPSDKNVQPIPDSKPDNREYINKFIYSLVEDSENKEKSKKKIFESNSDAYALARYLEKCIAENEPKFPQSEKQRQRWAKDFDLMLRIDKIDADDIAAVIEWSQNDNFWRSNILSGKKVREKYQQLVMKMKR